MSHRFHNQGFQKGFHNKHERSFGNNPMFLQNHQFDNEGVRGIERKLESIEIYEKNKNTIVFRDDLDSDDETIK